MLLTFKINTYFATLIVTIVGAGAALIIIHVANSASLSVTYASGVTKYSQLDQSGKLK